MAEPRADFAGIGHGDRARRVGLENGKNGVNDNGVSLEAHKGLSTRIDLIFILERKVRKMGSEKFLVFIFLTPSF
jgi:hypothetical protein